MDRETQEVEKRDIQFEGLQRRDQETLFAYFFPADVFFMLQHWSVAHYPLITEDSLMWDAETGSHHTEQPLACAYPCTKLLDLNSEEKGCRHSLE